MKVLLVIVLLFLFLGSVLLDKARQALPTHELRRRARGGQDKQAASIYKMASYGSSSELLLWFVGFLSAAGLFLWAAHTSWWLAFVAVLLAVFAVRGLPAQPEGWTWWIAARLAPGVAKVLSFLQPLLGRVSGWLKKLLPLHVHTGVYEKEDLLELLEHQGGQVDNRVSEAELRIAIGALTFADKTAGSIMTPRRVVKMVAATEPVGPLLMDELHASGFSRFPVVKEISRSANPEIVGALYLKDLIGYTEKGKVRDVMKRDAYFINETQDLREALTAFLKTHHHLLMVVNNFEEFVGVLSIEDVLEQILGEKIVDEFDRYDDLRSVAGLEAKKDQNKHSTDKMIK